MSVGKDSLIHLFEVVNIVLSDIRELVQVTDVMEDSDLKLGPNGGLVFCME